MIAPVCITCLRSGILCESCQQKLDNGDITQLDVDILKEMITKEKSYPLLKKVEFVRTIGIKDVVLLQVNRKSIPVLTNLREEVIKPIERKLGIEIHIVSNTRKVSRLVAEILSPIEILGVDTIFVPDGTTERKIRISKTEEDKIYSDKTTIEKILHQLTNENFRILFE
ncbi:MAG: hypothetical protein ACTSUV_00585 [Candidatus Ranarchaeia archaeon]